MSTTSSVTPSTPADASRVLHVVLFAVLTGAASNPKSASSRSAAPRAQRDGEEGRESSPETLCYIKLRPGLCYAKLFHTPRVRDVHPERRPRKTSRRYVEPVPRRPTPPK